MKHDMICETTCAGQLHIAVKRGDTTTSSLRQTIYAFNAAKVLVFHPEQPVSGNVNFASGLDSRPVVFTTKNARSNELE